MATAGLRPGCLIRRLYQLCKRGFSFLPNLFIQDYERLPPVYHTGGFHRYIPFLALLRKIVGMTKPVEEFHHVLP